MKTVIVPIELFGHTFQVPIKVQTWADFKKTFGEEDIEPATKRKIQKEFRESAKPESQRGKALLVLLRSLLSSYTDTDRAELERHIAHYRRCADDWRARKREGESTSDLYSEAIQRAEELFRWHGKVLELLRVPFPKNDD